MIAANGIHIYGDVKPLAAKVQPERVIDCRTCANVGWGTCMLFPHQCSDGSAYKATRPIQFWRQ